MTSAEMLAEDCTSGRFALGQSHGRWRMVSLNDLQLVVAVTAPPRADTQTEYGLRLMCDGYRARPALGVFWNIDKNAELEDALWPVLVPGRAGVQDLAFRRNWRGNNNQGPRSLYIPCDRNAVEGPHWANQYPLDRWNPDVGIACYLEVVHERLASPYYIGNDNTPRSP